MPVPPSGFGYNGEVGSTQYKWIQGHSVHEIATVASDVDKSTLSFSIVPSEAVLPKGVYFNPATGEMNGLPTEVDVVVVVALQTSASLHHCAPKPKVLLKERSYTIVASNSGGSLSITMNITVVAQPPRLQYSPNYFVFNHGYYNDIVPNSCPGLHSSFGLTLGVGPVMAVPNFVLNLGSTFGRFMITSLGAIHYNLRVGFSSYS